MNALVSVIIPTYNRHAELAELLESLTRQSYKRLQIVVVNDCGRPVEPITALYPELTITIVNMETNVRHVEARNRGLRYASGEYILLCDDDDLLLPSHIGRMVEEIADCDMVFSDVEICSYESKGGARHPVSRFVFAYEHDRSFMREFSTFVPSGCLYRRRLHDTLGDFDTEVYHYWDWDFYLRASERFHVKRVPVASVLYAFSQSGDNLSNQLNDMRPYLDLLSKKHGLGELPTKNFFVLLEEPKVKSRRAETAVLWDGAPFRSRLAEAEPFERNS